MPRLCAIGLPLAVRGANPDSANRGYGALHQLARTRALPINMFPHPVPTGTVSSLQLGLKLIAYGANVDLREAHERNRGDANDDRRTGNRYLAGIRYGIVTARRGWLSPSDVMNTRPLAEFEAALRTRP